MAGVSFDIAIDVAEMDAGLARLLAAARDLSEPMDDIGDALVASTRMRFERGIGPDGARWPVSAAAAARAGQTLIDEGNLFRSIVHEPSPDSVAVGSNLIYARIHQLGGKTGRGHAVTLPARPYLGLDEGDMAMIRDTVEAYLRRALS